MANANETALTDCRFLSEDYFLQLYKAFIEAYSDYVIQFALTETQFRNHILLNAVDLSQTVGCFEGDRLVGFSLNGFGEWEGKSTAYDAGTGVVPDCRRQGISTEMFGLMLPVFKEQGTEQCLLEVVTTNTAAVNLYQKLGFQVVRELALLQCDGKLGQTADIPQGIEIREIVEPDWPLLMTFWDGRPSWQNSVDALKRSQKLKTMLGAFADDRCVGYIVFSSKFGRVAQLAVAREHRNRGIDTALLYAMQAEMSEGFSMQVINIDKSLTGAMSFFTKHGFYERLSQYEMVKPM